WVYVQHERVEHVALAFGHRAAQRTDLLTDRPILIEPVLGIPDGDFRMLARHIGRPGRRYAHGMRKHGHFMKLPLATQRACLERQADKPPLGRQSHPCRYPKAKSVISPPDLLL